MNSNFILKRLSSVAASVVALMIGGSPVQTTAAAFDSPEGDWDFSFTGSTKGVAQITFLNDFTVSGIEILMPKKAMPIGASVNNNPRGGSTSGVDPRTGQPEDRQFLYAWGGRFIDGFWGYDEKGKVVGAVTFTSNSGTNGMSFVGTVVQGTRMTLRASDATGKMIYRGVPRVVLPDISGDYSAVGKKGRSQLTGLYSFTPSGDPNIYDVVIRGPGYTTSGIGLLTSTKQLGIYYEITNSGPPIVIAVSGAFNSSKLKGTVTGTDGTNNISLKIVQPQLP